MKKQFLFACCIIISSISFAQLRSSGNGPGTPTFGIRAGLSYSGLSGDAVTSLNNLLSYSSGMVTTSEHAGFYAGIYTSIPAGTTLAIEPGIYYSQKGYDMKGSLNVKGASFLNASAKAQLLSDYIDVPVLVKATFGGLQVFAGPQVSYLAKATLHTTAGVLGINLLNSDMDATPQFNRWDAGFTAGFGYEFTKGLNIMASYDIGLTKVDANQTLNAYTHAIKVGIGVSF